MKVCEAGLLGWQWGVDTIVPMHHDLWRNLAYDAEATLDPQLLASIYLNLGGQGHVIQPTVGGEIVLSRRGEIENDSAE